MKGLLETKLVDAYCERKADGLAAEPVNVISSLIFIAVAMILSKKLRRMHVPQVWDLWLLVLTLGGIGVGSVTWHLFARHWAELTDIIPITLFINVFLLSFLLRIARLRMSLVVGLFVGFQLLNFLVVKFIPTEFLNGSMFYAPAWAALAIVVIYLQRHNHPLCRSYLLAIVLLTTSIVFRSIDLTICSTMPLGTHFLWHIINALVLYLLLTGLISTSKTDNIIEL